MIKMEGYIIKRKIMQFMIISFVLILFIKIIDTSDTSDEGLVTFIFDDGHKSIYENAYPIFNKRGYSASVAINTKACEEQNNQTMSNEQVLEMQKKGWEVMSHSVSHQRFDILSRDAIEAELKNSKNYLTELGYDVNQFVAPFSTFPFKDIDLLKKYYKGAYTTYADSRNEPIERLVIATDFDEYKMHRVNMEGKTIEQLKKYIDYVNENKVWIVFYEHKIGTDEKYTSSETLDTILEYINSKEMQVTTGSEAVDILKSK